MLRGVYSCRAYRSTLLASPTFLRTSVLYASRSATTLRSMATTTGAGGPQPSTINAIKTSAEKALKKEKPDQKFTATLLLPKTAFPLRSEPKAQESFRPRCTTDLYPWQVKRSTRCFVAGYRKRHGEVFCLSPDLR
jgi:hypothetical protein